MKNYYGYVDEDQKFSISYFVDADPNFDPIKILEETEDVEWASLLCDIVAGVYLINKTLEFRDLEVADDSDVDEEFRTPHPCIDDSVASTLIAGLNALWAYARNHGYSRPLRYTKLIHDVCPQIVGINPGEADSFGWLTAVATLELDKKYSVVFG